MVSGEPSETLELTEEKRSPSCSYTPASKLWRDTDRNEIMRRQWGTGPNRGLCKGLQGALCPGGLRATPLLPAKASEAGRRVKGGGEV